MVVTTFGSLCDLFISSTCHSILHLYPLIYLVITHQFYQFILNPHLSRSVLSFTKNSSAVSSVPYRDFRHSEYIILRPYSSMVMYFLYRYGSIRANNYNTIPLNFKSVLPLVSSVCNKSPEMSSVATSQSSLESIMYENIRPCIDTVGDVVSYFCIQSLWGLTSAHLLPLIDKSLFSLINIR